METNIAILSTAIKWQEMKLYPKKTKRKKSVFLFIVSIPQKKKTPVPNNLCFLLSLSLALSQPLASWAVSKQEITACERNKHPDDTEATR